MAEPTAKKQRGKGRPFQPGQSGNPDGRPKGSRNKLAEDFIAALAEDFEHNGKEAIRACREENPAVYVRTIASILPKDVNVTHTVIEQIKQLSDDELIRRIAELEQSTGALPAAPRSGRPH